MEMNKAIKEDINEVIELSNSLFSLTTGNYKTISYHFRNVISISDVAWADAILTACEYRPCSIPLYAKLVSETRADIIPTILDFIFQNVVDWQAALERNAYFRFLFDVLNLEPNILPALTLVNKISQTYQAYGRTPYMVLCFCWFAPEIEAANVQLFNAMMKDLDHMIVERSNPTLLCQFKANLPFIRCNNWANHRSMILNSETFNLVANYIIEDDVDQIIKYVNTFSINLNQVIEPFIFEPSSLLQQSPTLIQYAAFHSATKCFKYLIFNGGNIDIRDGCGCNLAQYAIAGGSTEIIRYVNQFKGSFDGALDVSSLYHRNEVYSWLLTEHPEHDNAQFWAAESSNFEYFQYADYDIEQADLRGQTVLHHAVKRNRVNMVHFLLSNTSVAPDSTDNNGRAAIHLVTSKFCLRALLGWVNINARMTTHKRQTLLHTVAETDKYDLIDTLAEQESLDLNAPDDDGRTALSVAAEAHNQKVMTVLVQLNKVEVNTRRNDGLTPLLLTTMKGDIGAVKTLLKSSQVDINSRNNELDTALHLAVSSTLDLYRPQRIELLRCLLSIKGIDVNATNKRNETPLAIAERNGFRFAVELIIAAMNDV